MVVDTSVQCACDQQYTCVDICIVIPYVARNKFAIVVSHYGVLKKKKKKKKKKSADQS